VYTVEEYHRWDELTIEKQTCYGVENKFSRILDSIIRFLRNDIVVINSYIENLRSNKFGATTNTGPSAAGGGFK